MHESAYELPDWINEFALGDDLFARAYDAVPDHNRALLKTCIARLWEWYEPSRKKLSRESVTWRGGFASVEESAPVDCAVVVFDGDLGSPARLLASVVPAVACGVKTVLPVCLDGDRVSDALLVALELAGLELVAAMDTERVKTLLEEMDRSGRTCSVIGLELGQGVFRSMRFPSHTVGFTCLKSDRNAVLWADEDGPFDLEALAFAHPDAAFGVYGADIPLPSTGFSRQGADFDDFLKACRETAYVPASRVDDALTRARLVLGPGQEGCWVWPQLRSQTFFFHSTAWTTGA